MRPGLCHLFPLRPAPPGHTRCWGALGGAGGISPTAETPRPPPRAPPRNDLWPGSLSVGAAGRGLLVMANTRPPPQSPVRRLVCARVCVLAVCVGALSAPSVLKHGLHQSQDLGDGPLPLCRQGKMNLPSHIPPRSSGDLCTPKSPTVPPIPFLSPSRKSFLIFLAGFVTSLHWS